MEVDQDVLVEDADIVISTELNDVQETVNPAALFTTESGLVSPQLQEHHPNVFGNEVISRVTNSYSHHSPDYQENPRSSADTTAESIGSMNEVATPPHRSAIEVVIPPRKFEPLPYSSTRSGLVYDVRMRFHTEPPSSTISEDDIHPEDPRRIFAIYQALVDAGLVQDDGSPNLDPDFQLFRIEARNANPSEICLVHSKEHFLWVKNLRHKSDEELQDMAAKGDSIYLHKLTFDCALLAAGGAIEACRAVVAGHVRNAVAVIRPPGHHAERNVPGGFCFFNNVCIAARVCQGDYPQSCRKVLILDWDVHHGNGIQNTFYDDPNVLYISLHVHKNGTFYPFGSEGDHQHCGQGPGLGRNVNIPWADIGMGDGDYIFAFQQIVMPIATEFDPDLVIIAAGFDAAEGDLLGACHVSPPGYAHMTHMLMSLAGGKIAVCLEGGYNLSSIAKSALAVTRTLMGEPPDRLPNLEPSALGVSTVQLVKQEQSRHWKCMYPKNVGHLPGHALRSDRLHDVIRAWQSKVLFDEYNMVALEIYRDRVSKSFEDQVLATENYMTARSLLIILHDPPLVQGMSDPKTAKIELHKYWLTDVTKTYVDWAIKHEFGVMDVNIPKHITDPQDFGGHVASDDAELRSATARELITYLWENYIEISDAHDVFILGVGTAYDSVVDLLCVQEGCESRISHVFGFVSGSALHAVKRPTDDMLARWYSDNSHIFVDTNHLAWDPDRTRKVRKKYGRLIRSPKTDLSEMLVEHHGTVTEEMWNIAAKSNASSEEQEKQPDKTEGDGYGVRRDFLPNASDTVQPAQSESGQESYDHNFRPSNTGSNNKGALQEVELAMSRSPPRLPPRGYFNVSPSKREGRERTSSPRSPGLTHF